MHCYVYFKAAAEDEQHIRQCFARLRLSLEKLDSMYDSTATRSEGWYADLDGSL